MILTKENIRAVDFDHLIKEKTEADRLNELLIIVPTNRKVRHLKKELISNSPAGAASDLHLETITTISSRILQSVKPFKQLSEAAATVFIKQSAAEIQLRYFSQYKEQIPFGTLDRIKNVISEYKRHGISPLKLSEEAEKLDPSEKLKALDIAGIYEKFRSKCFALNAFETGDIYEELNHVQLSKFVSAFRLLYPQVGLIILDGFSEFSDPEAEIVDKLSSVGSSKLYIRFDYFPGNKLIFSHIDKCYNGLTSKGFNKIDEAGKNTNDNFRDVLHQRLFESKKYPGRLDERERIFKISAHSRESEVELISREIKKLILVNNAEPHKICVAFNLIQNYSSIIKETFNKNGIPVNLSDRTLLDNSNPITAIVNFLEIQENDFYFKNIFRALSSKFVETEGIDISNLYRISSGLKIVAGKENWINVLGDIISNTGISDDDESDMRSEKTACIKALGDIKAISKMLEPFEGDLSIDEFQARLNNFIIVSKLPIKLLEIKTDEEKNIRAFTDFLETINEIFQLLKVEYGADKKFPIGFYMDQIRTACNWARFNVKEKSDYGVQITSLEEIRGLKFDYLFIGGMCDGDFPTRYQPEIFVSGSFKKRSLSHQSEERYRFYQSLCTWEEKLYLTFPSTIGGRESVVSSFLKEFEELFEISAISEERYSDAIFSKEGLQIHIGRFGLNEIRNKMADAAKVNLPGISRSLEVEEIRNQYPFGKSEYTGELLKSGAENPVSGRISEELKLFATRQYSVSQLETYAKCPFKFFLERVLGVQTIEEPTEDVEAIEMGRILHTIFFEFYSKMREDGLTLTGCSDDIFRRAEELIYTIAERQLKSASFKSPLTFYEREKILGLSGDRRESVLNRFLESEREGKMDFLPKYFEVSFGRLRKEESDKLLSDSEPISIDGIKLRGKIDRIEINEKTGSFNIVDYKLSGARPSFNDLKNGISLQLPVYTYAAGELLSRKNKKEYSPNEMFIYSLKYSSEEFGKKTVKSKGGKDDEIQSVGQLVQKSLEHVKNYINFISEGKYHLSPLEDRENKICRYCQFRTVCRIDEASGRYLTASG
ncbi:MAG: PD-(D/E)XK nuclease family protein [Melioribacteraceae bacterium]